MLGRKSVAIVGDVSQDKDVDMMMHSTQEKLGSLNVWFHFCYCLTRFCLSDIV